MPLDYAVEEAQNAKIKVIGVGGGGGNAVDRMIAVGIQGVEFIAVNTDAQALKLSKAQEKVQIGVKRTKGLGAGAKPEVGKEAAEENEEELRQMIKGADMIFISAGMGGGTGTGAAPVIADFSRDEDILTVGVVSKPFKFEGPKRVKQANEGIAKLRECVDSLIVVPNDSLLKDQDRKLTMQNAFDKANDVLCQGVQGITDLILNPGLINCDFADVQTIMRKSGTAIMGIGVGSGETRCIDAAREAITSPLLEDEIKNAKGLLFNICGPSDLGMMEVDDAAQVIYEVVDPENADIIFGTSIDDSMKDSVRITVLATGFKPVEEVEKEAGNKKPATAATEKGRQRTDLSNLTSNDEESLDDYDLPTFRRRTTR